jgi:hypothetical protein
MRANPSAGHVLALLAMLPDGLSDLTHASLQARLPDLNIAGALPTLKHVALVQHINVSSSGGFVYQLLSLSEAGVNTTRQFSRAKKRHCTRYISIFSARMTLSTT